MLFLAVDSSLRNTGVAFGEITDGKVSVYKIMLHTTEKDSTKQVRASSDTIDACRSNFEFLEGVIKAYMPDVIFAETPSGSQSSSGMKSYGATCQLIASLKPVAIEVTPHEVKMASVGKKTASKKEMMDWASNLFPELEWDRNKNGTLKNKNEHTADAIGIVYAGINTRQFKQLEALVKK